MSCADADDFDEDGNVLQQKITSKSNVNNVSKKIKKKFKVKKSKIKSAVNFKSNEEIIMKECPKSILNDKILNKQERQEMCLRSYEEKLEKKTKKQKPKRSFIITKKKGEE